MIDTAANSAKRRSRARQECVEADVEQPIAAAETARSAAATEASHSTDNGGGARDEMRLGTVSLYPLAL